MLLRSLRSIGLPLVLLVLALPAVGPRARGADADDAAFLRRLADPGDPGHDDALAAWKERSEAEQVSFLRTRLASENPDDAARAAAEIGAPWLSLLEMHRRMALLRGHFEAAFYPPYFTWGVGGVPTAGIPDVLPLFRDLAMRTTMPARQVLDDLHRTAVPAQIPDLVPLLDRGDDTYFLSLLFTIATVANEDRQDRYRPWVARALDYGLDRILASRHGKARPKLDPSALSLESGPGLPDVFTRIAKAAWGLEEGYEAPKGSLEGTVGVHAPWLWLHRWMLTLTPADADGIFVASVAQAKSAEPETRFWAMRHLVRLSPKWGGDVVTKIAAGTDAASAAAAAALAISGKPEAWRRVVSLEDPPPDTWALDWAVDPVAARERWLGRLSKEDVLAGDPVFDIGPEARQEMRRDWGASPRPEDLQWIGEHLRKGGTRAEQVAWYFAHVLPEALSPAEVAEVAKGLADLPKDEGEYFAIGNLDEVLGWLEVWDPEALKALLSNWLSEVPEDDRGQVLVWLAALGDTDHVDAMLASWQGDGDLTNLRSLGHVADPKVEPFLLQQLEGENPEIAGEAFAGLAIARGIPEPVFSNWIRGASDADEETWAKAVQLLRSDDTVGAVLALRPDTGRLGLIDDPRVEVLLRRIRDERGDGLYWDATAGLALRGDAEAKAELLGLVREGHMWLFDSFNDAVLLTRNRDPEFLAAWAEHVESNCCLGWATGVVLHGVFPTMPVRSDMGGATTSAEAAAWLKENEGRFRYSRIRQGWLPGPK